MAKVLMIQGTMSNSGKSLITAGLCRIFTQDGYKVAPFKSQNMALNSFITNDGLEMGRAQVVQAQACKIEPCVYMNPILLKPTTDMGSQVIVNGKVIGNMKAVDYFKYKKNLIPKILEAFNKLNDEFDIVVIEGAGSPAEINLKDNDIVNMGMAKMAKAPVLLVGDIDRGGVFAQLVGTIMLLENDEKNIIKGMIINKFRGDKKILEPGLDMLEEKTNLPIIGVVPYMNIDIEDEDSLSEHLNKTTLTGIIDIAVIKLPHISNFTDINPLKNLEDISIRYVKSVYELKNPDMIIIAGTKNTIEDLKWLRQNGLEATIKKLSNNGTLIFGICGGYQMLGNEIIDNDGIEKKGIIKGMGLLPINTIFLKDKTTRRVQGKIQNLKGAFSKLSGAKIYGYEIHMGNSFIKNENSFIKFIDIINKDEKNLDGMCINNVCGTYVHGIFDSEDIQKKLLDLLYEKKGIKKKDINTISFEKYKDIQYDLLADEVRKSIDMKKVYEILERGI